MRWIKKSVEKKVLKHSKVKKDVKGGQEKAQHHPA